MTEVFDRFSLGIVFPYKELNMFAKCRNEEDRY